MKKTHLITITMILAITILASSASSFSFFNTKPTPSCLGDNDIEKTLASHNNTYLSKKVTDYVTENNYNNIRLTIKRDRCKHHYHITISDDSKINIEKTNAPKNAIKVTTTYTNLLKIDHAYKTNRPEKIILCAFRVKAPVHVWYNSFLFLKSCI